MNLQHLIYFRTVAETENFTLAAKELYITPSTLSKAIASLDEELRFPLFLKSGRNSVLTDYGKEFKKYVDKSIACIETGIQEVRAMTEAQTGTVTVSGIYVLCLNYLPEKMKEFLKQYPNIQISLAQHYSIDVIDRVLNGKYDIGFCSDFDIDDKRYSCLTIQQIRQEEMVIVTSKEHPLASRTEISLEELMDEKFIINSTPSTRNRTIFLDMCNRHHLTPNIAFEIADDQSILGMIYSNLGISCMVNIPAFHRDNLHVLRLLDKPDVQTFYMIRRNNTYISPASKLFWEYIILNI